MPATSFSPFLASLLALNIVECVQTIVHAITLKQSTKYTFSAMYFTFHTNPFNTEQNNLSNEALLELVCTCVEVHIDKKSSYTQIACHAIIFLYRVNI